MRALRLYTGNVVYGRLPQGCRLCLRGLKSVIFVTGLCPRRCFYCPISLERRGHDSFYANERPVGSVGELVAEVAAAGSRGAGLTGGDPLARLERTLEVIRALKESFGSGFHIHLYTSGELLSEQALDGLSRAGLDELRLHPEPADAARLLKLLERHRPPFSVGLEIPARPEAFEEALKLLELANTSEVVEFVNVNELEVTESNSAAMRRRGYELSEDGKTVRGSREVALRLVSAAESSGYGVSVHFCPASSKDAYQLRLRLYRRGVASARPHEMVSDEGTILKALVPEDCASVPSGLAFRGRLGLETSLLVAELLGARHSLVEELPDYRRTLLNVV